MTEITPVVRGSFKHLIGLKELYAQSGAYKHKIVSITRVDKKAPLGFNLQRGDGFGRQDGIFISRILFGSVFDISKVISVGEEIIKIDDKSVQEMTIREVVEHMFDNLKFSMTVKVYTPCARIQSRKRWYLTEEPPVSRQEDLKRLNMKILPPKGGRHSYVEEEVAPEEIPLEEEALED